MARQQFIDSVHIIIKEQGLNLPDVILGLSQILTDIGLSLWQLRSDNLGLKPDQNRIGLNPQLLKAIEKEHYSLPGIDSALILQAALMILWVEDWINKERKEKNNGYNSVSPTQA